MKPSASAWLAGLMAASWLEGLGLHSGAALITRRNMLTDNWPVDFTYISRRIVKEIVQQHEAGRSERALKISLTGSIALGPISPGISFESSKRQVDYDNYFDLAKRATVAVSDHTGWLARDRQDRILTGQYVRAKIHMQVQKVPLPVTVWEKAYNHPVAIFAGIETVPGVGRVFIGLAGSASNFLHVHGGPSTATRTPSDAVGIYDIIQQSRELTEKGVLEPGISAADLAQEFKYCSSEDARFQEAISLFNGCGLSEPSALVEVLIRVHHLKSGIDLGLYSSGTSLGTFDLVILGAPVWVGSVWPGKNELSLQRQQPEGLNPEPSEVGEFWRLQFNPDVLFKSAASPALPASEKQRALLRHDMGSPALHEQAAFKRTRNWDLFDSQLEAYLRAISQARPDWESTSSVVLNQWPPSRARWQEFGEWFVSIACRLGPDPIACRMPVQRRPINIMRGRRSVQAEESILKFGWSIPSAPLSISNFPNYKSYNITVLLDGTAWTFFDNRSHRNTFRNWQVARNGVEREAAAASILWTIVRWRTPMTNDDKVPRIEIVPGNRWWRAAVRTWQLVVSKLG